MERTRNKSELAIDYRTMDTNIDEFRCLIAILIFRGVYQDTKQILNELWYSPFSSRLCYRVFFNFKRYQWLMKNITFHNQRILRQDFLKDWFARISWLIKILRIIPGNITDIHLTYTVIDGTLRNFDASFSWDFKVYFPGKPGKYGILFRSLADAEDHF